MEEFTFGTLATDELKLIHHRAARRGLQHAHELDPPDPEPGQPVTLTVRVGPGLDAEQVACYFTLDGSQPEGGRGVARRGQVLMLERTGADWDTLMWGYLDIWQGSLPAQPEGTRVRYQIGAWSGDGPEIFADWPETYVIREQAARAFFSAQPLPDLTGALPLGEILEQRAHTFAYSVDRLSPPDWARQAVIYHVFVDRFYPGQGRDWLQTGDLLGFCGGTLWGLAEKMDYVASLGATCLWLSPIFPSPTHHGYDATGLYTIEPRLGGDEALRTVVAKAHQRGIRVLLDFVCNHVSNQHPLFLEAKRDPSSPYRDYFTFDDSELGYRTYFGVATMPEVNVTHPAARNWLIEAARFWLREFDVVGYRLDHANGPGPDFWTDFWTACKAEKPDCFCFGEVVDASNVTRSYYGRLDGCLNFFAADALRRTYALDRWTEEHMERALDRHFRYFPPGFVMPTFIDNHDMDRFLFLARGDKVALRRAIAAQMRLPGPPIVYYGTEVGLNQATSIHEGRGMHINRVPMIWGDSQDRELLEYVQALIRERRSSASE